MERFETGEHSFNTSFSVCIPSLNPPAQKKKTIGKKEKEKGKGLQLNTHIRGIHFGDIYNHAVINKGKDEVLY